MKLKNCQRCKKNQRHSPHPNTKYCMLCKEILRREPAHALTPSQAKLARKLAGTMTIQDLAKKIGVSESTLRRFGQREKVSFNYWNYTPQEIDEVCLYYLTHGKKKTKEHFKSRGLNVRSIVQRHFKKRGFSPRSKPWKDDELINLARFSGLLSFKDQAKFFDRPRANEGSIRSAWNKKFKNMSRFTNGVPKWIGQHFVKNSCPFYISAQGSSRGQIQLILWLDFYESLKDDIPEHIKLAAKTMAKFQLWLHGEDAKKRILELLEGKI